MPLAAAVINATLSWKRIPSPQSRRRIQIASLMLAMTWNLLSLRGAE
jgi:hypothetical protein